MEPGSIWKRDSMLSKPNEPNELERFAAVAEALCRVAGLGRALRRSPFGTHHVGLAIEGTAAAALLELLTWTQSISSGPARALEARIRSSLGHGDRALLGTGYLGELVVTAGRRMASLGPDSLRHLKS